MVFLPGMVVLWAWALLIQFNFDIFLISVDIEIITSIVMIPEGEMDIPARSPHFVKVDILKKALTMTPRIHPG